MIDEYNIEYIFFTGAHAVGACPRSESGFTEPWTQKHKQFSNQYFIDVLVSTKGWEMVKKGTSANPLYQWVGLKSSVSVVGISA